MERQHFIQTLKEEKPLITANSKLENLEFINYEDFKKELLKQKVRFSLGEVNNQWREYFIKTKEKLIKLKNQIYDIEVGVDNMIYEIYQLHPEEIELIKNQ